MNDGISLYGKLARTFKKKYNTDPRNIGIKAKSVSDAMRGMEANFPGFRALLKRHGHYAVSRGEALFGGKPVEKEEVSMGFGKTGWHFMPVAAGCGGGGGWFGIIAGAILIVAGVVINIYAPGAGTPLIMMGAGMMLGGISQLLFPMPKADKPKGRPDENPSYLFDGPKNHAEPGATVPIAYGETWIGSIIASAGLEIEKI